MLYLMLSILCSVSVGVIFKIAGKNARRSTQLILCNYVVALLLCYLFFEPETNVAYLQDHWALYGALMVLLPSIFLFLAASVKHVGIVKTDAAQRLSLFIPILAAWLIFREAFNGWKILGLAVGFPALLLILSKKGEAGKSGRDWLYPAVVLLGFGIVDTLFKQVALLQKPGYTTSLFIIFAGALVVTFAVTVYEAVFQRKKIEPINFAYGLLIGIFNFGNILFYLKAHKAFAENPSTVFASMNMGVIVLGSLTGVFLFKEKLTFKNYIGIVLALLAIIFITLSQIFK
ncbi:EamA/RhaT family transporter [Flavobacterium sp. RHBU_3]|uniref:EamA family transporter n=1 Tax=Flavobacterium sp. RHBU_3 TaxID=3391184 RepID=UPI00398528DB